MAGRVRLSASRYGKDGVRLVRLTRAGPLHRVWDLTVRLRLEGDFQAAYEAGSNADVLPTDTMRNTVYALAASDWRDEIEEFGIVVARRLLEACPAASLASLEIEQQPWARVGPRAFAGAGPERLTAGVRATREGDVALSAGLVGLRVLKTAGSAFEGFLRDRYTTLEESRDRLLATEMRARWDYLTHELPYGEASQAVQQALVETFAAHDSRSVQHTLYAMAEAALAARPELARIALSMPNLHHLPVDLAPFGLDAAGEVFMATDRPFGVIEATVEREP